MGRVLVQLPGSNTTKLLSETLPKNVIVVDEQLHQLRVHDGTTPGGHVVGDTAGSGVPIGTIIPFAGNSIPQGYLLCDGSAISRTNYASLFAVIGTIYGAGDGNTTFNIPNLYERVPQYTGIGRGNMSLGSLPNIIAAFGGLIQYGPAGATINTGTQKGNVQSTASQIAQWDFNASRCSATYGRYGSDKVFPAHVCMYYVIKYI